jgi:hypothetical protein
MRGQFAFVQISTQFSIVVPDGAKATPTLSKGRSAPAGCILHAGPLTDCLFRPDECVESFLLHVPELRLMLLCVEAAFHPHTALKAAAENDPP